MSEFNFKEGIMSKTIKYFSLLIVIFFFNIAFLTFSYAYDLEIQSLDVDMIVSPDNSYTIQERIDVNFFEDDLHGIFRAIPTRTYYGKPVEIDNVQVSGYPFQSTRENGLLRLRIGDPDVTVGANAVYDISYTYSIGDDRNEDMDELYFNIVGPQWEIPINQTSFRIEMPQEFDASQVNFTYGNVGSTENTGVNYSVEGNVITGSLDEILYPGQALTIALPLPEGYYTDVEKDIPFMESITRFYPVIFILLFAFGIFLWFKFGKDNKIYPTVEFYPPDDLTPSELGYIYDSQIDPYDLTAMIVYWADKGYLKIIEEEEETGIVFKKTKSEITLVKIHNIPEDSEEFEKIYFNGLFSEHGSNGEVKIDELENHFYKTLAKVRISLKSSFQGKNNKRFQSKSGKVASFFIVITAMILMFLSLLYIFSILNPYDIFASLIFAALATVFSSVFLTSAAFILSSLKTRLPKTKVGYGISGIFLSLIVIAGLAALVFYTDSGPISLMGIGLAVILYYISPYAHKRTKKGDEWMAKILGFKSFIENAEKDRINTLVEEDPQYFYHILPYAMALGVTDKWADQFENIALEAPEWYQNASSTRAFSAVYFASHLNAQTQSMGQAMSSSPSSSGSGGSFGGGMSGGGSGGGGGGGW